MTNEDLDSFRTRRLLWPRNDGSAHGIDIKFDSQAEGVMMKKIIKEWIATHSDGEFYLGHNVLCFYTPKDAMAFKLADCMGKAQVEFELKKGMTQRL